MIEIIFEPQKGMRSKFLFQRLITRRRMNSAQYKTFCKTRRFLCQVTAAPTLETVLLEIWRCREITPNLRASDTFCFLFHKRTLLQSFFVRTNNRIRSPRLRASGRWVTAVQGSRQIRSVTLGKGLALKVERS